MQKTKQVKLDNIFEKMNTIPKDQLINIKGGGGDIVIEEMIGG